LVDPFGVIALDARITLAASAGPAARRLAIRPYPKELEEEIRLPDGRRLLLRAIRPEDQQALQEAFAKLTPEEVRLRFFTPLRAIDPSAAARLTQIDYEREMALVLTEPRDAGTGDIYGVVRLIADADGRHAEFAIIVGRPLKGLGLGKLMMRRILDYARQRGIREVCGDVLRDNRAMLRLCGSLGFEQRRDPDDPGTVQVCLAL
jgi:acetyltransferase